MFLFEIFQKHYSKKSAYFSQGLLPHTIKILQ